MRKKREVFTNKTGTGTSLELKHRHLKGQHLGIIMAKLELSYGSTPTITIHIEGVELDDSWTSLVNDAFTTGSPQYLKIPPQKRHRKYRLNITANTNVTVDHAYLGTGTVED